MEGILQRENGRKTNADTAGDAFARELRRQGQRARRMKTHGECSTFAQLCDHYDEGEDQQDILEDHLHRQKLRDLRPLKLDTSDGNWINDTDYADGEIELWPGMGVLLLNGTFLRIVEILTHRLLGDVVLRGYRFVPTSRLQPILDNGDADDELVWDLSKVSGCAKSAKEQSIFDVPLEMVERRVEIHLSNHKSHSAVGEEGFLCRWKITRSYRDFGRERRSVEVAIERLSEVEADPGYRVPDIVLRYDWRGTLDAPSGGRSYTALDGFCCSGGWTRGATMAGGVDVIRSFDSDRRACLSYATNFPATNCLNLDVFDYCNVQKRHPQLLREATEPGFVDIAHYSTPCQYFSPAHTREGANDEANSAASYCLGSLVDKDRPRVITFENTSGLERGHFDTLKSVFGQITAKGYSLRFAVLNLADWGIPQKRKRLIMLAACPGETLPTFPSPTHSEDGNIGGTHRWSTTMEVIGCIPPGWQNHFPAEMRRATPPARPRPMVSAITCSGGGPDDVHPDGRHFTICEYQLLQGFPLHHRFAEDLPRGQMLRQIGNAFPPLFVKQLIRHIRRQLQRSDGLPVSADEDEFMSAEQMRDQEIAQFFNDSEDLPDEARTYAEHGAEGKEWEEEDGEIIDVDAYVTGEIIDVDAYVIGE